MPLILGTNSIKDTGYEVANSLRFNDGSSDALTRDITSNGNKKLFTFSFWVKRSTLGSEQRILMGDDGGNGGTFFQFNANDKMKFASHDGTSYFVDLDTFGVFRDVSAWYHLVLVYDSAQSTASNRVKLYVNGEQETLDTSPGLGFGDQNNDILYWNTSGADIDIGARTKNSNLYFDGYLAEVCFIDGQALDPTSFGEFDADTGIWKPIDVSGLTFGTNGFYLDFENSGSLGADVSGNGNNFTVNNLTSIDQSTDTCTNNFATINSLDKNLSDVVLSEGNLKMTTTAVNKGSRATIGVSSGKWFWEIKIGSKGNNDILIGIAQPSNWSLDYVGSSSTSYSYASSAQKYNNASQSSYGASFTTDDIIGVALNMDDGEIAFYKNGSSQGTAYTGIPTTDFILPAFSGQSGSGVDTDFSVNFGSPPYSESGGNSDGNGYGNFSMSVPSGYYSLNTKNLSEFG